MARTSAMAFSAASLAAGLLLSGCSLSLSHKKDDPSPTPRPTPTTPAPTSSAPTSSAPASPTASSPTAVPMTLTQRLLVTQELPPLTQGHRWSGGATTGAGTTPFGLCQRVDLGSVGATRIVQRDWLAVHGADDSAAEQIAEFPDAATAQRVRRVLVAWHDSCAKGFDGDHVKVRPVTDVAVPVGAGAWYLVSYTTKTHPDDGRFHAFGYVVAGKRIALLRIDNASQDYDYPPGREPMVTAVKSAAEKLR